MGTSLAYTTAAAGNTVLISSEIEDVSNALMSMFPSVIANNYTLIIGALLAYLAFYILKAGIKTLLLIVFLAVLTTILTNAGMMPNLNQILQNVMTTLEGARSFVTY